jgi:hypothetical protein
MKIPSASLILIYCLLSLAAFPVAAVAQDQAEPAAAAPKSEASVAELRRETYQAEEDFYKIFNRLNEDRDYDVRCFDEKATGTNIKTQTCRARFVTNAYERHARRNRNDVSRMANQSADPVLAEKTAIFQEKLETAIATDPELQAALIRFNTAQTRLAEARGDGSGN